MEYEPQYCDGEINGGSEKQGFNPSTQEVNQWSITESEQQCNKQGPLDGVWTTILWWRN